MSSCCGKCYHCQGALPESPLSLELEDQTVRVCSAECANTAQGIVASGLSDFYSHRDQTTISHNNSHKPVDDWRTYERPAVMQEFVRQQSGTEWIADLLVQGVHCAACTWLIENKLNSFPGTLSIEVNPVTTRAQLRWNPEKVRLASLLEEIEKLGYMPVPFTEQQSQAVAEADKKLALRRLLVAGLGMMQVTSFAVAMYAGAFQGMDADIQEFFRLISLLVATPVVMYSGAPFFSGAWRNLSARRLGMDVPVALAIGAAWVASVWNTFAGSGEVYFDSATMFVFFLSGTRYLEAAGRFRAFDLTHALAQHIPRTATRITTAGSEEIGVMELQSGDTVLVAEGLAFPADGVLQDARTTVDESMLTGESVPVQKLLGDSVAAGTINNGSAVRLSVSKTGAETVLAHIGRLVTQAGDEKPELIQLTDRIASYFVGSVLLIAAGTAIYWLQTAPEQAFEIVLSVLVVTCPCALALATPAALTVATSALAKTGFLVRRGGALPALAKTDSVVFDKTGTLTANTLEIDATFVRPESTPAAAIRIASAIEMSSAHPIARAFRLFDTEPANAVTATQGQGLEGMVDNEPYRIGTLAFAAGLADGSTEQDPLLNHTNPDRRNIYLGDKGGLLARFEIVEKLREGATETLSSLEMQDIHCVIASGDQTQPVANLAERVGASEWHAELLPEDKLRLVRDMQSDGKIVAAAGDGINDSPVLAGADVSIAMGNGTSAAQHSADCIWLGNQLTGLDHAFTKARRTMQIVRQNLIWALCYNACAIPLAISGQLAPWMAALGMSLSSLLVTLNALRLGFETTAPATPANAPAKPECCASESELRTAT